uniref:Nicotinamidase-like amidase n=1 Tax=Desulfovibrio sp. U5L TaxID=596152 RepID=I2PWD1_9BACT
MAEKALIIVDMLNDFITPGGRLYFAGGSRVVEPVARLRAAFRTAGAPVLYDNDAHPEDSAEFRTWPPHCVAGTAGARIVDALAAGPGDIVFHKDALSLFSEPLAADLLRCLGAHTLYVTGVATEYCVKEAVLGALAHGFAVVVVVDAIAGAELEAGDGERAMEAMRLAGAAFASTGQVVAELAR